MGRKSPPKTSRHKLKQQNRTSIPRTEELITPIQVSNLECWSSSNILKCQSLEMSVKEGLSTQTNASEKLAILSTGSSTIYYAVPREAESQSGSTGKIPWTSDNSWSEAPQNAAPQEVLARGCTSSSMHEVVVTTCSEEYMMK